MRAALPTDRELERIEAEAEELRGECRLLLGELERRYDQLIVWPRRVVRLGRGTLRAERLVVGLVRTYPVLVLGSLALLFIGGLVLRRR